jgi:hypothetical protein
MIAAALFCDVMRCPRVRGVSGTVYAHLYDIGADVPRAGLYSDAGGLWLETYNAAGRRAHCEPVADDWQASPLRSSAPVPSVVRIVRGVRYAAVGRNVRGEILWQAQL